MRLYWPPGYLREDRAAGRPSMAGQAILDVGVFVCPDEFFGLGFLETCRAFGMTNGGVRGGCLGRLGRGWRCRIRRSAGRGRLRSTRGPGRYHAQGDEAQADGGGRNGKTHDVRISVELRL